MGTKQEGVEDLGDGPKGQRYPHPHRHGPTTTTAMTARMTKTYTSGTMYQWADLPCRQEHHPKKDWQLCSRSKKLQD